MSVRPATHSGSWYSKNASVLERQLETYLRSASGSKVDTNRILIGPHAGYDYAGSTLAKTYKSWDADNCKTLIIMGPSHHVYYKGCVMVSPFERYATPFGDLDIDTKLRSELIAQDPHFFKTMTRDMDEDEHSFEMHMPFVYKLSDANHKPKVLPIMISHSTRKFEDKLAQYLAPYFADPSVTFAISSDFCHWGSRFRYTAYTSSPDEVVRNLTKLSADDDCANLPVPIYKGIEFLDKKAMQIISSRNYSDFKDYIDVTGNTICGERPIGVLLRLIEDYETSTGKTGSFSWLGYQQSSKVTEAYDSSVSYASGFCVFD